MALDLRRSTVYDFSDLRLHRDGTRIQQTDRNYEASSKRKFSVRDAHGKWRAKDAAGLGTVQKMRCANLGSDTVREHGFEEQGETRQLHTKRGRIRLEEKKRGVQPIEHRTVKRWRFEESLDFLDGTPNEVPATSIEDKANLPVPSSELLKNIHYIAAEFYTERGQLLNLGKKYRAEKKRRRKGKNPAPPRKKRRVDEVTDTDADRRDPNSDEYRESSSSDPEFGSDSSDPSSPSEADGDNESSVPAEEVEDTPSTKSTKERKKRYTRSLREIRQKHQQDMYRVMNGSALMVLGMLVQEHVAKLVRGKVPEGWEEGLPPEDEEERSEEGEEQVESERESEEEEGEDDDEDEDIESEMGDDSDDSGRIDEVADDNRRRRW